MSEQDVVIDNGSGVIKAGFSGEHQPSIKFPSIIGKPRQTGHVLNGAEIKQQYIGDEAQKMKGVLNLSYPIQSGIVTSWDDMERVWEFCMFNELRIDPSECNILMTEAPTNPKGNREKTIQTMFETFQVKGFYTTSAAILSLYAMGKTTGLVVDSGDDVTHTVPIYEGYSVRHAIFKSKIAGRGITEYMTKLLNEDGITGEDKGEQSTWFQIVNKIKEQLGYVSSDYTTEMQKASTSNEIDKSYELPDGSVIHVNTPRFKSVEALFDPSLSKEGSEELGMHQLVYQSIQECDKDIRHNMEGNVLISGGSTLFPGLPQRLEAEIDSLYQNKGVIKVEAPQERYYSAFAGGSTLCSLSTFSDQWISQIDYEENGPEIVHRKCV